MAKLSENHISAIAGILDISTDDVSDLIDGASDYRLDSFNVDTLKEVLKYLKAAGIYRSKLQLSKAQLVDAVQSLLKGGTLASSASDTGVAARTNTVVFARPISSSSSVLKVATVVNTARRKEVYMELMNIPGITQQEVLMELSACTDSEPDPDVLLFQIISKRQAIDELHEAHEKELQVQENADVDRAIAESEHERDVIQKRKRARVQELREDPLCLISTADEYKSSVLLSRSLRHSDSSSSSSSTSGSIIGSSALLKLVKLIDDTFSPHTTSINDDSSESVELDVVLQARKAVTDLLLLEIDAAKYHKKAAIPYLCGLSIYLDRMLSSLPFPGGIAQYVSVLVSQSARLQRALYKLPSDGHMVPLLFRTAFADPVLSSVFNSSIDEDGFEMVTKSTDSSCYDANGQSDAQLYKTLYEEESEPQEDSEEEEFDDDD